MYPVKQALPPAITHKAKRRGPSIHFPKNKLSRQEEILERTSTDKRWAKEVAGQLTRPYLFVLISKRKKIRIQDHKDRQRPCLRGQAYLPSHIIGRLKSVTLVFKALSDLLHLKYSSRKRLSFTYEMWLDIFSVVPFLFSLKREQARLKQNEKKGGRTWFATGQGLNWDHSIPEERTSFSFSSLSDEESYS